MDSSMIVAMMAKNSSEAFQTFAIGVKEQSFNELPYARVVADRYQTRHTEQVVESNIVTLLPKMIWHLDEPSDPIAACQFHAAELAARDVKVVMGGDGGDELFAGFDRYLGIGYLAPYAMIPAPIRQKLIGPILDRISENFEYKSISQKLRWAHQLSLLDDVGERYAEATCFFRFNQGDKHALYNRDLWRRVGQLNSADIIVDQFNRSDADHVIDKMLYTDFMTRLPEHSLMLTDRMAMAHGLEARSPFLDHELVEFLAAFPCKLKIRGRKLKYALRLLAQRYLPDEIVKRKKQGFMFPVAFWFRNELHDFLQSFLINSHFVKQGLFKKESVLKLIEDHRHNRVDNHVRLWMLLNLEIWHQIYIQQIDPSTVGENLERHLRSRCSISSPQH
jgi:asparagine synthase (glutamine-hydrolysing)